MSSSSKMPAWVFYVLAAIIIFGTTLVVFFVVMGTYFKWPTSGDERTKAVYLAIALGMLPIVALFVVFLQRSRGALGFKAPGGFEGTVDFGKTPAVGQTDVASNIFASADWNPTGEFTPSHPKEIVGAVSKATSTPVVTLDIDRDEKLNKGGWLLTRLYALSAGALRYHTPEAIVFVATRETIEHAYLGWAEPRCIFESLSEVNPKYKERYDRSEIIFHQLSLFDFSIPANPVPPVSPAAFTLMQEVLDGRYRAIFTQNREYAFIPILLDQLKDLEEPRPWLTRGLLDGLFGQCWHTKAIELNRPGVDQVETFFEIRTHYIALVRSERYLAMISSQDALKTIVKHLLRE